MRKKVKERKSEILIRGLLTVNHKAWLLFYIMWCHGCRSQNVMPHGEIKHWKQPWKFSLRNRKFLTHDLCVTVCLAGCGSADKLMSRVLMQCVLFQPHELPSPIQQDRSFCLPYPNWATARTVTVYPSQAWRKEEGDTNHFFHVM